MTKIYNRKQELETLKLLTEQMWDVDKKLDHIIGSINDIRDFIEQRGAEQ
jgi:hypothetical protein